MAANLVTRSILSLTCNTATPLSTTSIYAASVTIYADDLNTGYVYIGGSNVTSGIGIPIVKKQTVDIGYEMVYGTNGKIDLSKIYLDCDTTGNAVRVNYFSWDGF